jgi:hypothetical protein
MSNFKKGDLVFIPSNVTLLQFDHALPSSHAAPNKWYKTKKPGHAVKIEYEKSWGPYCKILYGGQYWFTNEENMFEVNNGS